MVELNVWDLIPCKMLSIRNQSSFWKYFDAFIGWWKLTPLIVMDYFGLKCDLLQIGKKSEALNAMDNNNFTVLKISA